MGPNGNEDLISGTGCCCSHYLVGKTTDFIKPVIYTFVSANSKFQWDTGLEYGPGMSAADTFW